MGLEVLAHDGGDAELVKDGLLGDEGGDGLVGRGGEPRGGLLEGEGVGQGEDVGALDGGGGLGDGVLGVGGGGQDVLQGGRVGGADGLVLFLCVSKKIIVWICRLGMWMWIHGEREREKKETYINCGAESIQRLLHVANGTLDGGQVPLGQLGGDGEDGRGQEGLSNQGELHFDIWGGEEEEDDG